MGKPSLFRFDAFAKTLDDARVKTASGGILTIACIFTIVILLINEYGDYRTVVTRPELVVDRDHEKKLDLSLDITFPSLPCDVFSMDVMDITGEVEADLLDSGFTKVRLDANGKEIGIASPFEVGSDESVLHTQDPDYCGPCYGSLDQSGNDQAQNQADKICCNSCAAVKAAYAKAAWKFYDGEGIEQCEKEGYVKRINDRLDEGCRVKGKGQLNRIGGNLHFAPGSSISVNDRHVHDMSLYDKFPDKFSFDHIVNHFAFGNDNHAAQIHSKSHDYGTTHPLDGHGIKLGDKYHLYSYFLKVVNSRFEYLNGDFLETNEFSVSQHDRPLRGGRDDDHPNTIHARGGLPGVFFYFDISPMKIINREEHKKTWSAFILSVCSTIAGVLTVFSLLDKTIWTANRILQDKKKQ